MPLVDDGTLDTLLDGDELNGSDDDWRDVMAVAEAAAAIDDDDAARDITAGDGSDEATRRAEKRILCDMWCWRSQPSRVVLAEKGCHGLSVV